CCRWRTPPHGPGSTRESGPDDVARRFDEHPNDDAEESRELRHSHTLASSPAPFGRLLPIRTWRLRWSVKPRPLGAAGALSQRLAAWRRGQRVHEAAGRSKRWRLPPPFLRRVTGWTSIALPTWFERCSAPCDACASFH